MRPRPGPMYVGVRQDLLTGPEGLHIWLASNSLDRRLPADVAAPERVPLARETLASAIDSPGGNRAKAARHCATARAA
ncbi:hypothetical protein ACH4SK_22245 [Streptomyces inhibens]|uniref:hypothetical protein n=1 Tax=Streptomyces inhibens TaxID=2293571 RepID=UPI0037B4A251